MENKNIPDAQITASSEYNNSKRAFYGRLNLQAEGGNAGAWSAISGYKWTLEKKHR